MANNAVSEMKKALLLKKQKLLDDLNYYDKRIEQVRTNCLQNNFAEDDDSSDSDTGLPLLDFGSSVPELKIHQSKLKTCLQATQELTSLQVLQSEVNVMVEDPVLDGEPLVTEAGTWWEVTAECRIDYLPFSIMFYAHKPSRPFGRTSYRGLRVAAVKAAHEAELVSSVLPTLDTPADAIQVLRSYILAYRSRRTSLAKLAERYGHALFMEPNAEGGFLLKCANLLEVLWRLDNTRSPLAAFHHNMRFNFEYMDECYVKIITQAHKELSNPNVDTDERTFLLSKIISTCLEAQGPTQELYESMESDPESVKRVEKRRTTLDHDIESPDEKKKTEDNIMAPPKYLPKRTKPKGKENTVENSNKGLKRTSSSDGMGGKRAKISKEVILTNTKRVVSEENDKRAKKVISESEIDKASGNKPTVTDLVNKNDEVSDNIEKTKKVASKNGPVKAKANKVADKGVVEEYTVSNIAKAKKTVKAATNDAIPVKSKVIDNKDPQKDVNLATKSVTANTNGKTKETADENAKTKETTQANANTKGTTNKNAKAKETTNKNVNTKEATDTNAKTKETTNKNVNNKENTVTNAKSKETTNKNGKTKENTETSNKNVKTNENAKPDAKIKEITNKNAKTKETTGTNARTKETTDNNAKTNEHNIAGTIKKQKSQENLKESSNKTKKLTPNKNDNQDSDLKNGESGSLVTKQKKPNEVSEKTNSDVVNGNLKNKKQKESKKTPVNQNVESNDVNPSTKLTKKSKVTNKTPENATKAVNEQMDLPKKPKLNEKTSKNKVTEENNKNKESTNKLKESDNVKTRVESTKSINNKNIAKTNEKKNVASTKDKPNPNIATNKKSNSNTVTEKNVATNKSKDNIVDIASLTRQGSTDNLNKKNIQNKPISVYNNKPALKILNKHNMSAKRLAKPSTSTFLKPGSTEKKDGGKISSKIPQKAMKKTSESVMKKNPLRISPRKIASMFKSPSQQNFNKKILKPTTNIPRLMTNGIKTKS